MLTDTLMFSTCLLITGVLIFILVYFLITLSDLECDYLNASECCAKLNFVSQLCYRDYNNDPLLQWNVPKLWLQVAIISLLFVTGHGLLLGLNLPVTLYLLKR